MGTPSPGYAVTVRVDTPSSWAATGSLVAAVAVAGGSVTALDIVESHADHLVIDLTCDAIDVVHVAATTRALAPLPDDRVRKVSDRPFLMHLGGKLQVVPKVPLKNLDDVARTGRLGFLSQTTNLGNGDWTGAPTAADLLDRRVEIVRPTDRRRTMEEITERGEHGPTAITSLD